MVAGWAADGHVVQHLLDDVRVGGVGDVVRAEHAVTRRAEGHVVAQDGPFRSVPSQSQSTIVVSATCESRGFTSSGSSMLSSLVRPITFSCSSTDSAFHAARRCTYFCTTTQLPPA